MTDLQIFKNPQFGEIRAVERGGEPWFLATDVCRALEIDRTQTRRLDDDEKGVYSAQTPGGDQPMTFVNEPGLYSLVLGSRKPEAKAFKRWITHEVIPTIRKHGAYMTPATLEAMIADPDTTIRLLAALKNEQEQRKALEAQAEINRPKVLFADAVTTAHSSILVGELAKLLRQNGVDIGQNRLFKQLRNGGFLIRRHGSDYNMPTQKAMDMGLFEIKESSFATPDGVRITKTPKVTGKGQQYFINRFLGN